MEWNRDTTCSAIARCRCTGLQAGGPRGRRRREGAGSVQSTERQGGHARDGAEAAGHRLCSAYSSPRGPFCSGCPSSPHLPEACANQPPPSCGIISAGCCCCCCACPPHAGLPAPVFYSLVRGKKATRQGNWAGSCPRRRRCRRHGRRDPLPLPRPAGQFPVPNSTTQQASS